MTPLLPAFTSTPEKNKVYHLDLFDLCAAMPSQSVDLILCDLPYGTTACAWDEIIPFDPMWKAFKRVIKSNGAIVLTATEPFTSRLVCSNLSMFRYRWIWEKGQGTDFQLAKLRPLSIVEDVCVFSHAKTANGAHENMVYYPQMLARSKPSKSGGAPTAKHLNNHNMVATGNVFNESYPTNILRYDKESGLHPTQKPTSLFRYLIRTYTQPGELVFDPCVGSGTTAVSAREEGRSFIVGDSSMAHVEMARDRLATPWTPSFMLQLDQTA
jgi:site-specific DNA-methyltransferase (adenine-specific)